MYVVELVSVHDVDFTGSPMLGPFATDELLDAFVEKLLDMYPQSDEPVDSLEDILKQIHEQIGSKGWSSPSWSSEKRNVELYITRLTHPSLYKFK